MLLSGAAVGTQVLNTTVVIIVVFAMTHNSCSLRQTSKLYITLTNMTKHIILSAQDI